MSRDITYEMFKDAMDSISAQGRIIAKQKQQFTDQELGIIEICLSMLVVFDALSIERVQNFCDAMHASETEDGRRKFDIVQPFARNGTCRAMNNRLQKLISRFSSDMLSICRSKNEERFDVQMSNAMDAADEMLHDVIQAYVRLLDWKLSRKTLSTAVDPKMLSKILTCIVFCDLSANIYDHITSSANFQIIAEIPKYRFLRLDALHEQVVKMLTYMDFRDTKGKPLKFNLVGVKKSPESQAVLDDIIRIVYSSEFINGIFEARTGQNPNFGNGKYKSFLPSLESSTLSIEKYKELYKTKFHYG